MGSQVVKALVQQVSQITTAVGSPNPSSPIEQFVNPKVSVSESMIQQLGNFSTATVNATSTSNPVLQFKLPVANFGGPPDNSIIEQIIIRSLGINSTQQYDGPVLQVGFSTSLLSYVNDSSKPIQQRTFTRKTDADGTPIEQKPKVINTILVEQIDFIDLILPPCASIKNPVDSNLLWRIKDFGFPFDTETLIFKVDGIEVQDTTEFEITDLGTGLQLFYDPPENFDYGAEVNVDVSISDTANPPNTFAVACSFFTVPDTRPPIVRNAVPCGQTDVGIRAPVEFDITDVGAGVDVSSIVLSIEGLPVCSGISITEFTTISGNGFHVKWEHPDQPFKYGSNVSVSVEAHDLSPAQNSTLFLCDFDVEESHAPVFENFDPRPCETFVDNHTGLTFEIYGNIDGVDISTLEVRVDNVLRKVYVRPRVKRSE